MFDQTITTKVFHEKKSFPPLAMMYYEKLSDEDKKSIQRHFDAICEWYAESDNYKKDTKELDYIYCCEHFGHCGMSTGMIILIVLLALGVLAGGAAAFWFFCRMRKRGGKEKMVEENTESTGSTEIF